MSRARAALAPLAWTTLCLALALIPLAASLPAWISVTIAAAAAIRLALAVRGGDAPPAALRLAVAALAIGALFLELRTFNGLAAGTALLGLTAGLKLLETRTRRDLYVVLLIVYFLSFAALLAHESFWLLLYLAGVCWLSTAALLRLGATADGPGMRASLGYGARILLQALPLAAVLWLFFPRLAVPLWQVGGAGAGVSGLGDTMSPGDIDDLALSDAIAFRVRFFGRTPPHADLYWRGPVLDDFDGRTWARRDETRLAAPAGAPGGTVYRYRVSLEPYRQAWVYALDRPFESDLAGAFLSGDDVLTRPQPTAAPFDVTVASQASPGLRGRLDAAARASDTALPAGSNPRTLQFARALRREHPADRDLLRAVLARFHDDAFYYTLTPPPLGANPVDEFLFDTKRGFCGHYASAFAVLMRDAGIPARVVTGYFGGTYNPYAGYWIVRQSDAHAWVEVWIEGRGWLRIDPTAAVAPQRVDPGLRDAVSAHGLLTAALRRDLPWLEDVALRFDALRVLWRERVLRYDQSAQDALLARLRVPAPDAQKLVWALAAAMAIVFAWLTWHLRRDLRPQAADEIRRAFDRFAARLAAIGVARAPHEGAEDYARRVAALRPDLAAGAADVCRRYSGLRYGKDAADGARGTERGLREFKAAVRAFKPPRSRAS